MYDDIFVWAVQNLQVVTYNYSPISKPHPATLSTCRIFSGFRHSKGGIDKLSFFVSRYVIPALSGKKEKEILCVP